MTPPPRDPRLDTLRGVAISAVLILHFTLAFGLYRSPLGVLLGRPIISAITLNGNYGVTMFFVISGFLITRNVLARDGALGTVNFRRFYAERFSRIAPPLLTTLAILVPLGLIGLPFFANNGGDNVLSGWTWFLGVISILTFWHNELMQFLGYFHYCLNVYWSLSVEEAFYLGFPILCRLLKQPARIAAAALVWVAMGPAYRAAFSEDDIRYLYAYPACFDAIAIGCLTALICQRWTVPTRAATPLRWLAAGLLAVVWGIGIDAQIVWGFTEIAIFTGLFIWASQTPQTPAVARSLTAPLQWLGRQSYELYLLHILVLSGIRQFVEREDLTPNQRLPLLVAFFLLSAAAAALMARFVSIPAQRALRKALIPPQPTPTSAA